MTELIIVVAVSRALTLVPHALQHTGEKKKTNRCMPVQLSFAQLRSTKLSFNSVEQLRWSNEVHYEMITMHDFCCRFSVSFPLCHWTLALWIQFLFIITVLSMRDWGVVCTNVSVICCWSSKTCMRAFDIFFFFVLLLSRSLSILQFRLYLFCVGECFSCLSLARARVCCLDTLIRTHFLVQPNLNANVHLVRFLSALRRKCEPMRTPSFHFLHFAPHRHRHQQNVKIFEN